MNIVSDFYIYSIVSINVKHDKYEKFFFLRNQSNDLCDILRYFSVDYNVTLADKMNARVGEIIPMQKLTFVNENVIDIFVRSSRLK